MRYKTDRNLRIGVIATIIVLNLAWWAFVIWAIVSIVHALQH